MKVIPIISAAGGVGKTTLSLMLAYVLSLNHYNVLLIDMDPTAGLTLRMFGDLAYQELLNRHKTLIDMVKNSEGKGSLNIDDYVVYGKQVRSLDSDIQLYPGFNDVAVLPPGEGFDEFFAQHLYMDIGKIIWRVLNGSNINKFDAIIIDTAPFFDERYTLIALHNVERAVVVLRPTLTDIKRTNAMISKVSRSLQESDKPVPSFTLVFNFEYNKYFIEAKTLESVLKIRRLISSKDKGTNKKVMSMNLTDRTKRVNEMLERGLRDLTTRSDVHIDHLEYVIPYDAKFSDESFPQVDSNRKVMEDDYIILTLTLKSLIERFGINLDLAFDIIYA